MNGVRENLPNFVMNRNFQDSLKHLVPSSSCNTLFTTRMHSSRMHTVCCSGYLPCLLPHMPPCHACPPPCMPPPCMPPTMHTPLLPHMCPLAMHMSPSHTHPLPCAPCHACPLATYTPLPCMPPAMHAPLPCMPPCHACALPCTLPCEQNDRGLWKHNLSATTVGNYEWTVTILVSA